jgi:DNA-binding transcriptional ArsR family regulator
MNASDGILLAQSINEFTAKIKELGPRGEAEGLDEKALKLKLQALRDLVPYIRLVERERLRAPRKEKEKYYEYYNSEQVDRLIQELIIDKLAMSQIMLLLRDQPLSTSEIAETLGLKPSQVSKYINTSSRQGLVRYDEDLKRYAHV